MFEEWQKLAADAGISLTALSRYAGIDRDTIERWKKSGFPKSVKSYQKINDLLEMTKTEEGKQKALKLLNKSKETV